MSRNEKYWPLLSIALLVGCNGASLEGKTACREQSDCLSGHACIDDVCVATSEGCDAFCANACSALVDCDIEVDASCMDDCIVGLGSAECGRLEPLDRLSCGRLEHAYECAGYCQAVCERGAECATIDVELCALGCVEDEPEVCNVNSIPVRECEPIKAETRLYDNAGRALVEGSDYASGGTTPSSFGLCADDFDCDESLVCSPETSTCAMCQSDADCDSEAVPHACTPEGCVIVDCLRDEDCFSGVCDTAAHECRDCREDADCTSEALPACDQQRMECVTCTTDEHCAMGVFGASLMADRCDVSQQQCVQCLEDSHCADSVFSSCDLGTNICVPM